MTLAGIGLAESANAAGSEWYFNWGYNRNFWAPTDIHISQPALNSEYTIHDVKALDYPQWEKGPFANDLTIPQFNLRFGWFLETQHEWALELSIDHTKYNSTINQRARVSGVKDGVPIDQEVTLTSDFFNYRLHNGVNHIMLSLVKRTPLLGELNQSLSLSMLTKAGAGILLPHAESTIDGKQSDVGGKSFGNSVGRDTGWWQLNGWTAGAEVAFRFVVVRPVYLEIANKVAYGHLYNVPIYQGRASHNLWLNAVLFAIGFTANDNNNEP